MSLDLESLKRAAEKWLELGKQTTTTLDSQIARGDYVLATQPATILALIARLEASESKTRAHNSAVMEMTAAIVQLPDDDAGMISRERCCELIVRWRTRWDVANDAAIDAQIAARKGSV